MQLFTRDSQTASVHGRKCMGQFLSVERQCRLSVLKALPPDSELDVIWSLTPSSFGEFGPIIINVQSRHNLLNILLFFFVNRHALLVFTFV
jgi:hypothetical protein